MPSFTFKMTIISNLSFYSTWASVFSLKMFVDHDPIIKTTFKKAWWRFLCYFLISQDLRFKILNYFIMIGDLGHFKCAWFILCYVSVSLLHFCLTRISHSASGFWTTAWKPFIYSDYLKWNKIKLKLVRFRKRGRLNLTPRSWLYHRKLNVGTVEFGLCVILFKTDRSNIRPTGWIWGFPLLPQPCPAWPGRPPRHMHRRQCRPAEMGGCTWSWMGLDGHGTDGD